MRWWRRSQYTYQIDQRGKKKFFFSDWKKKLPFEEIFSNFEKAVTSDEMLNSVCDMVFEYADADKNGTISEDECKFPWNFID